MSDDLEQSVCSTEGDLPSPEFVASLRERVAAEAEQTRPEADLGGHTVLEVDFRPEAEEHTMNRSRGLVAVVAAAAIALIVGIVVANADDDSVDDEVEAVGTPADTDGTAAGPAPDADADAGCGLSDVAGITATVDATGESVTFDITSNPACAGVSLDVSATSADPETPGFPILRTVTLDDAGEASVTDNLQGRRQGVPAWNVELLVTDSGRLAATTEFSVAGSCDFDTADVQATYLPDTGEVDIVFTIDPLCAGETFTFDDGDQIFADTPSGGWEVHTVDDEGRIETTEQLVVDGPIIGIDVTSVPETRGATGQIVARVVLDIGG